MMVMIKRPLALVLLHLINPYPHSDPNFDPKFDLDPNSNPNDNDSDDKRAFSFGFVSFDCEV
jgi:hypothetical protein